MKQEKNLKKIIVILVLITIILISFAGIYVKTTYKFNNIVKNYTLGMEFRPKRITSIVVDVGENETARDAEGNIVEDYEEGQEGITIEKTKINPEEVLNIDNYQKVEEIMKKRLKYLEVPGYTIKQNLQTGGTIIELTENDETDYILEAITATGKISISDSETKEELLGNKDVLKAGVLYNTTETGTTVYLGIYFNRDGSKKLEEISKTYVKSQDEEGNDTTKKVTLKIDEDEWLTTEFSDPLLSGQLTISMGQETIDEKELHENAKQVTVIAAMIGNGNLPVQYKNEETVAVAVNTNIILIAKVIVVILITICMVYLLVEYRENNGFFASIMFLAFIAIIILIVRFSNTIITYETIATIFLAIIFEYLFINILLLNKKIEFTKLFKKVIIIQIPLLIIAVIFSFQTAVQINTVGQTMFWLIILFTLYNFIIQKIMKISK